MVICDLTLFVTLWQGVYGDNGSIMYHHGYGYAPYSPYSPAASPVPTMGHDGHLYGAQSYQYPTPYFQSLTPTSAPYNPTSVVTPKGEISTSIAVDQSPSSLGAANGNSNGIANSGGGKGAPKKQMYQNSSFTSNGSYGRGGLSGALPASGFQDPRFSFDGLRSPMPWLDAPVNTTSMVSSISIANNTPSSKSHNYRPHSHLVVCYLILCKPVVLHLMQTASAVKYILVLHVEKDEIILGVNNGRFNFNVAFT